MEGNSCTNICRFCLETCIQNFETIEDVTLANLDFLWLKLNLRVIEESVMCGECAVTITISSDFKSKCLEIENCIVSRVKDKDSIKIDLREVYVNKMTVENIVNVPEDHIVCRLCLELVKNNSAILLRNSTDIVEKLEQYFPELDLTCTDDPVICGSCHDSLQCYFSFINTCLATEEKITEYCKVHGINGMGQIDLNTLVHFILSKDFLKCKFEVGTVKIEETYNEDNENAYNNVEIKKEDILDMELDIKEDSSAQESELTDENSFQRHSSPSHSDCVPQLTGVQPAKYTCEICGKRKHDLHVNTYNDGKEATLYKCDLCDLEMKRKLNLKERMLTQKTYSEITMYKCNLCDYKAKRMSDLSRHTRSLKSHSDTTRYKCDLCIYQAKWKRDLKRHMLTHKTQSEVSTYKCDLCDYEAKLKANLKVHMLTHKSHLETVIYKCDYVTRNEKNIKSHIITHLEPTMYKCDLCDYEAKGKYDLKGHMLTHKTHSETIMYKCDLCDYQTKWKFALKRHIPTHKTHSETNSLCDHDTEREPDPKSHMLTHLETTIFKCDLCHYEAKGESDLKGHMLTHKTHSETSMYKCDLCDYKTKGKYVLKLHMLTHSETSMYKCDLCGYKTKRKFDLKRHMLTHKTHSEITMYKCDMCEYETKEKYNLKRHMLTHQSHSEITIYKCEACAFETRHKHYLKQHKLNHMEAPEIDMYKCEVCPFKTKWKKNLRKHLLSHRNTSDVPSNLKECMNIR